MPVDTKPSKQHRESQLAFSVSVVSVVRLLQRSSYTLSSPQVNSQASKLTAEAATIAFPRWSCERPAVDSCDPSMAVGDWHRPGCPVSSQHPRGDQSSTRAVSAIAQPCRPVRTPRLSRPLQELWCILGMLRAASSGLGKDWWTSSLATHIDGPRSSGATPVTREEGAPDKTPKFRSVASAPRCAETSRLFLRQYRPSPSLVREAETVSLSLSR